MPAGAAAGLGVLASYFFALNVVNLPLKDARTVATTVLVLVGLFFVLALEAEGRRRGAAVSALCAALAGLYFVVLIFPGTRDFFDLSAPTFAIVVISVAGAAVSIAGLWLSDDQFVPGRRA